jgi:tRNA-Thr(GGU) m(6)t(6)A37 methyltransferase TsaA
LTIAGCYSIGVEHHYPPIGTIRTPFTEKFGVPRQPLLVPGARGVIKLNPDPRFLEAVHRLDSFSHLWVLFVFDRFEGQDWRARIEPPRANGPRNVGVFASRSPRRPNPIGMSVVKLDRIDREAAGGLEILVSGVDLLDRTPILDLKPYLPYADSVPTANPGWATEPIERHAVAFEPHAAAALDPEKRKLIQEMLSLDPRPTSQRRAMPAGDPAHFGKLFRFRVADMDIEWRIEASGMRVMQILPL